LLDDPAGDCESRHFHGIRATAYPNIARIFWINLPLCVPSIAGIYFFINLESEPLSVQDRLKQVDWTGITILTTSLILLLFGVTSGGVLYPWRSAAVIASIIIGALGTGIFILYEGRYAKDPMIPLRIFANRTSASAYSSSFFLGFVLWAMQYYLILYVRLKYLHSQDLLTDAVFGLARPIPGRGRSLDSPWNHLHTHHSNVGRSHNFEAAKVQGRQLNCVVDDDSRILIDDSIKSQFAQSHAVWFSGHLCGRKRSGKRIRSSQGHLLIEQLFPGRFCAVQASQSDADVPMVSHSSVN